jgi:glycosyltransferase involved in cell wall biosynthesis
MMSVLAVGYSKAVFDARSGERARLAACAHAVGALHLVVFSRKTEPYAAARDGPLHLYPTRSRSRIGMLFDAYRIGSAVLASRESEGTQWCVSAQDPFEAGLIGRLLSRRYRVPLQVQEHGDFFGGAWWRTESALNRVRYLFGTWLVLRADCVRVVSKRVKEHLVAVGVDARKIAMLSVASDTAAFSATGPIPAERDLRARYPDGEAIVIAVGRLVKEKNFALLINAFADVVRRHDTAHLVIVGSGPEEAALRALAAARGISENVSFVSWTDDVASYMRTADIFALSSYREGWGRAVIEGMSAGIPGVVTDVGCAGEAFIHERHGLVVPVDDIAAFSQALRKLIANPALRLRYGAAERTGAAPYRVSVTEYAEAWKATFATCARSAERL